MSRNSLKITNLQKLRKVSQAVVAFPLYQVKNFRRVCLPPSSFEHHLDLSVLEEKSENCNFGQKSEIPVKTEECFRSSAKKWCSSQKLRHPSGEKRQFFRRWIISFHVSMIYFAYLLLCRKEKK